MYYGRIVSRSAVGKRKKADLAGLMTDFIVSGEDIMKIENPEYYESAHSAHCSFYRAAQTFGLKYAAKNGDIYVWKP